MMHEPSHAAETAGEAMKIAAKLIEEARLEERERCAKCVPTNWCDSLLTGKDAPKHPLDNRGVETLLRGIQDRIRKPTD